jgi:preprotein translocase subunit SecF
MNNFNLQIIKHSKIWLAMSGTIVVLAVVSFIAFGLNPGIDFTGGGLISLRFDVPVEQTQIVKTVTDLGYEPIVQQADDGSTLIRVRPVSEEEHQAILTALRTSGGNLEELRFDSVGPTIGRELEKKATTAIVLVLAIIGLYIAWAFRRVSRPVASWKYGLITLVTAFHDVVIPVGVFAILSHFFHYQADTAFVAALLTILGYSINDTIVVFDRTRENLHRHRHQGTTFPDTVNNSVNETLARSMNTTLATFLPVLAIVIFGGVSTRPFAITLLAGIFAGAYSSVFLASPLLAMSEKWNWFKK